MATAQDYCEAQRLCPRVMAEFNECERQRDALLAACKAMVDLPLNKAWEEVWQAAKDAIALAEGAAVNSPMIEPTYPERKLPPLAEPK